MSRNSKNTAEKRSSSNSAEEYRRYLIRMMRTGAGDISPDEELCQSRKQITGDVSQGSIKRVACAHTTLAYGDVVLPKLSILINLRNKASIEGVDAIFSSHFHLPGGL
jgi:hypothetical protein